MRPDLGRENKKSEGKSREILYLIDKYTYESFFFTFKWLVSNKFALVH